jgi:hypothetical protein
MVRRAVGSNSTDDLGNEGSSQPIRPSARTAAPDRNSHVRDGGRVAPIRESWSPEAITGKEYERVMGARLRAMFAY